MKITHIYAENYKTYRHLDLDLQVKDDRPIILVGGGNGCGKTTLFDAIFHALYGLEIKTEREFDELYNSGAKVEQGIEGKDIVLEISFKGQVLGKETPYKLKRTYRFKEGKVLWSVELNMDGNKFVYGVASTAAQRSQNEDIVKKIISANLPSELSNYFLFDAMKTSDLVKEEQINKLIMKNINSVMGFNKYSQLKSASENLLEQRKAEKIENENLRKDFERLSQDKKNKEEELAQLNEKYEKALAFSINHKGEYQHLKSGKANEETTIDRIKQQEEEIQRVENECADYCKEMESLMKDLEINVLFPKLASDIKNEVERIINEKSLISKERGERIGNERMSEIVGAVLSYLADRGVNVADIDRTSVTRYVQISLDKEIPVLEKYSNLTNEDVETLSRLVKSSYVNQFIQLDNNRENIMNDVKELPEKRKLLKEYKNAVMGTDYGFIATYEENESSIIKLKSRINELEEEIRSLANDISTYDYEIPQIPDPQYDMLCMLPEFLQSISTKLLAAKRRNIEDMMKEQLNINLVAYAGVIGKVSLEGNTSDEINFKIYHKNGNEIYLSQLNAGAKQTLMQVLLKVLYELGDYDPPVMIDTVMGVLDKESREVILENYFPHLAEQTILLSTDTEITADRDFMKLEPFVSRAYTLHRDKEGQCTNISEDYFGLTVKED